MGTQGPPDPTGYPFPRKPGPVAGAKDAAVSEDAEQLETQEPEETEGAGEAE